MAGELSRPNAASESSSFALRSASDQSKSKDASRSPSQTRTPGELLEAERSPSDSSSDSGAQDRISRPSTGTTRRPARQDTVRSLSALSVQSFSANQVQDEPKWPREWRAYVALFGGFLLMFNSWGLVNAYGTYASYYIQWLLPGQDILLLNLVGSTQSFVVLALSAVVGRFLDAGYIRTLIVIGTVFVSLGSFLLSIVNDEGQYGQGNYGLIWLTQGFVSGLGMACFFVSSSQVVATWFKAKKGLAIGIVASGASIAGLLYPLMTRQLIEKHGFNIATRYVATLICLSSALAIFFARPNPKHITRKPEKWFRLSVFVDTHAFQNRAFAWLCVSIAFLFFGFYAVFFNLEEWSVSEGFGYRPATNVGANAGIPSPRPTNSIHTYWLLAIMNACSTIGRIGSAYLCDHFGALNVHCVTTFVASLLVLILWSLASNLSTAIAFVVVFGAFSGAVIGLPPASVAYILGPDPRAQAKLGQWTGMMYTGAAIFALTGPVIAGHLISEYSTFLTVQLWAGACLFLSASSMGCAIYCHEKSKKRPSRIERSVASSGIDPTENEKDDAEEKEAV